MISSDEASRRALTRTVPASGVNFTAFATRFQTICRNRSRSTVIQPTSSSMTISSFTFFASAASRAASSDVSSASRTSSTESESASFPIAIRDTSRRSSMSWTCAFAFRSMTSIPRAICAGSFIVRRSPDHPRIEFSGFRRSCGTRARNASLATVASSAAWRRRAVSPKRRAFSYARPASCAADSNSATSSLSNVVPEGRVTASTATISEPRRIGTRSAASTPSAAIARPTSGSPALAIHAS